MFKAANGKMFAVTAETSEPLDVSVKCDPEIGEALRAEYASIVPGYHLNKRHWITITLGSDCPTSGCESSLPTATSSSLPADWRCAVPVSYGARR